MAKIRLNSNEKVVDAIMKGLKRRGGYCPCRLEDKEEYRCMCKEFQAQIADPDSRATATANCTTKKNK